MRLSVSTTSRAIHFQVWGSGKVPLYLLTLGHVTRFELEPRTIKGPGVTLRPLIGHYGYTYVNGRKASGR